MNHLLTDPHGLDYSINRLQEKIYPEIESLFGGANIEGYGKIYAIKGKGSKYVPKRFNSNTRDYEDIFWNDNFDIQFCFIPFGDANTEDEVVFVAPVKIVFSMNLDKLYPDFVGRADGKAQEDIVRRLRSLANMKINGIQFALDNIYQGYDWESAKFDDMSKIHTFAILTDLNFYLTEKCN